jgi:hypothetical protein
MIRWTKCATETEYAVCPGCKRGVGISKNGILRRHYRGRSKNICLYSGKSYKKVRRNNE